MESFAGNFHNRETQRPDVPKRVRQHGIIKTAFVPKRQKTWPHRYPDFRCLAPRMGRIHFCLRALSELFMPIGGA